MVTIDLDRSLQSFRTGPKPYFTLFGDKLVLKGVPVPQDALPWLDENPVQLKSYLGAFVSRKMRRWQSSDVLQQSYGREDKEKINAAILKEMVGQAHEKNTPLLFVLFTTKDELAYEGWREKFLKTQLRQLNAEVLDGKYELLKHARSKKKNAASYFLTEGHLSSEGNAVIAQAIAKRLKGLSPPAVN